MKQIIQHLINRLFQPIIQKQEQQQFLFGQHVARQQKLLYEQNGNIQNYEFKVFSQWGDDGIIQYLVNKINIKDKYFIEFGVENYKESNTRFLLMNDNWSGLVLDGSKSHVDYIKNDSIYWKFNLKAKCAFITAENINEILLEENITNNIGLLHIDIDGNDYWIWKAIEVTTPDIVIMEYNSVFGIDKAITIPYQHDFVRTRAHHSNLYAGASLLALCDLAEQKGYYFVGSNKAGNNSYFVKKNKIGPLAILTPEEGYVESKFREARNPDNTLNFTSGKKRKDLLINQPVFNCRSNKIEKIR